MTAGRSSEVGPVCQVSVSAGTDGSAAQARRGKLTQRIQVAGRHFSGTPLSNARVVAARETKVAVPRITREPRTVSRAMMC